MLIRTDLVGIEAFVDRVGVSMHDPVSRLFANVTYSCDQLALVNGHSLRTREPV